MCINQGFLKIVKIWEKRFGKKNTVVNLYDASLLHKMAKISKICSMNHKINNFIILGFIVSLYCFCLLKLLEAVFLLPALIGMFWKVFFQRDGAKQQVTIILFIINSSFVDYSQF